MNRVLLVVFAVTALALPATAAAQSSGDAWMYKCPAKTSNEVSDFQFEPSTRMCVSRKPAKCFNHGKDGRYKVDESGQADRCLAVNAHNGHAKGAIYHPQCFGAGYKYAGARQGQDECVKSVTPLKATCDVKVRDIVVPSGTTPVLIDGKAMCLHPASFR